MVLPSIRHDHFAPPLYPPPTHPPKFPMRALNALTISLEPHDCIPTAQSKPLKHLQLHRNQQTSIIKASFNASYLSQVNGL